MSDTPRLNLVCPKQYEWAYNKIKLNQAYSALVLDGTLDQKSKLDEKTEEIIKAGYINRKGLLTVEQKKNIAIKRPRSTSNTDR